MRIICISDTHSLHPKMLHSLPKGEILIHSGDCTNVGKKNEIEDFIQWFQNIEGFDNKIFIAGNHDFGFEYYKGIRKRGENTWIQDLLNEENLSKSGVTYLEDSFLMIESPEFSKPIKIYGSPWQPEFYSWAFNLPRGGKELESKWREIPNDTNILITHGPPHGYRDYVMDGSGDGNVGCELLRKRIDELKPSLHVFGHIHCSYGASQIYDTLFVNASICTESYHPINKPIVVDLNEVDGEIIATLVDEN